MFDLLTLNNIEEYFKAKSQRKPVGVYFHRIIGYDEELLIFLRKYQTFAQRKGTYINKTIQNPDASDVQYLCSIVKNFDINIKNVKQDCTNWLKFLNGSQLECISEAIYTVLKEIAQDEANINIIKNAYIKFLYWLKYKFENSIKYIEQDEVPKILYEGDIGKYELYMLRILSLAGCDVIYINFLNEESYMKFDKQGKYSIRMVKQIRQIPPIHFSKIDLRQIEERKNTINEVKQLPYKLNTNEWLKNDDFLNEILEEKQNRNRDLNEINNIFIEYVGIDQNDEYNNRLYSFKNKIEKTNKKYILIQNGIQTPSLDEVAKLRFEYKNKEDILFGILKKVNIANDNKINQAIKCQLSNVIQNLQNNNMAKIYNTSIKLLCWIERYCKKLFLNNNNKELPILIFFGDCNSLEATFLCIMANLPIDVIYINPNKDNYQIFNESIIKKDGKLIELQNNYKEKMEYPKNEVKVRATTVAYNAEKELDNILYSDTGMFRNKQFKRCQAITLKTTFEEIKILWKEEAKYRPGFKVEENKVIVPNIFAKICGVKDSDINNYVKSIQDFITKDTILIKDLPHIKKDQVNVFYGQSHKFVEKDKIRIEEIKKCKDYKYGFLNNNTQDFILSKIQEMIDLKLISCDDLSINQKIVATLLDIEKEILRILQKFDFTKEIPKVIVIDTDEDIATLQDCILLMFLNLVGFDIIICTPTGYQNIEKYIGSNLYEEYQIGDYIYNMDIPKFKKVNEKKQKSFKDLFRRRN